MSRELDVTLTYDAPVDRVAAMLATRGFREAVCDRQHALSKSVTVTPSGAGHEVLIEQEQSVDGVPGFVRKLIGDTVTLTQAESWTSPSAGDITVSVGGQPVDIRGTADLVEDRGQTIETVRLTIKVRVLGVGGKIETMFRDLLDTAMQHEHEVGVAWLASGRG